MNSTTAADSVLRMLYIVSPYDYLVPDSAVASVRARTRL